MIPERTLDSINNYVQEGIPPGHFVQAVLENNLFEAFARGDEGNLEALLEIIEYVYNHIPAKCWGSQEKVRLWLEKSEMVRNLLTS